MFRKVGLVALILIVPMVTKAQCAMCRAALQTEQSGIKAEGVNNGIKYLATIPYVLAGLTGYVIYRWMKKK